MFLINIFQYLAIYLTLNKVFSLKTVHINNLPLKVVSPLLNKIQDKYGNIVNYVEIQPNILKTKEINTNSINRIEDKNNNVGNNKYSGKQNIERFGRLHKNYKKILIKRLIPHGLPPSKLEFDSKFKTIYKPLVRIHKRKRAPKIGDFLNLGRNPNDIGIDKYGIDIHDYYDNDEDVLNFVLNNERKFQKYPIRKVRNKKDAKDQMFQPFTDKIPEKYIINDEDQLEIIKKMENLLKQARSRESRLKIYDYVIKALDADILRTYEKSGEDNDPMAPGKTPQQHHEEDEEVTPKPKFWLPHYPPWNYWTYKKTIHQDECPDGQVKIANLCIWIPPH